jgi:hypothetical protein
MAGKKKILTIDELTDNAKKALRRKGLSANSRELFENVLKKAASPKQGDVKRPQT